MESFAYTLTVKGKQPVKGIGSANDLELLVAQMNLAGLTPPDWIIANPTITGLDGSKTYIHDEGGKCEWRLRWVPFT
ncbi:hypothetical protein DEM27_22250 [Metarhizobium album]|uniref:Uncharacterized protein n=1 Tax=Metarhizobium album TaxID=2182425 RepID=A0A2U2DL82_9HYPH|nr:hypothetical protein [Rhizobium album]PWE54040.1 hypothetical protein DEM27_22250 [Rhizobium album]